MAGGLGIGLNLGALTSGGHGSSYAAVAGLLWEPPSELVLNGDFEELGDNGISYPSDVSTTSNFILDSTTNLYTYDKSSGSTGQINFTNAIAAEVGQTYKIVIDITISSGNALVAFKSSNSQTTLFNFTDLSNGVNTLFSTVAGVNGNVSRLFVSNGSTDNNFTLNSISVQQVDPNDRWTLGTGWSISDGKLNFDTDIGDGTVSSTNILTVNNIYRVTFDVNITDGVLRFESGDGDNFLISSSGTYTHEFKADLLALKFRRNETPTRGYIDNVSVKEFALKPYPTGTVSDYNLIWDLDGLNYMPQASPTTDGNWEVVGGEIIPKEI